MPSLRSRRPTNGGTRFRRAAALSCEWMNELRRPNDEGTIMRGNRTAYRIATGHHEQIRRRGNDQSAGVGSLAHGRRSEEHTSELQSRLHLVCRLLLEKKKKQNRYMTHHTLTTASCHIQHPYTL